MSAWTWTFVKAKAIPKDIVNKICDEAINSKSNIWFYKKAKENFQKALKEWIDMHDKEYDYFVNECGVSPNKMTHEYLQKELKTSIEDIDRYINDLNLVKDGKLTLDKCLRKHKVYKDGGLGNPYCYYIQNTIWVKVPEIFRLQEYSNMDIKTGLKTIDSLIEYISDPKRKSILTWCKNDSFQEGFSQELEIKIREYYSQFGNKNFSVHFG